MISSTTRPQQRKTERTDVKTDGVKVHVFKLNVSISFGRFTTTPQEKTVAHFPTTTVQTRPSPKGILEIAHDEADSQANTATMPH